MRSLISILLFYFYANVALGGIIVSTPDLGWHNQDRLEGEEFRWSATARNMSFSPNTPEQGIGINPEMPAGDAPLDWSGLGTSHPFSLMYDPLAATNTPISVAALVHSMDDFAADYGEASDLRHIHIGNFVGPLSDMDFILSGTLFIDWEGVALGEEDMGMQMEMSQIPEPMSIMMVLVVSGMGLFIRRRFRQ